MSVPRDPIKKLAVVGSGQLAALTAFALKRALPQADVAVIGTPPSPAAWADQCGTALPFTNRLHDRLGITEDMLVSSAAASHRLVMHYVGWGGQEQGGSVQHGMAAYGAAVDPKLNTIFAREWGGGQRNASSEIAAGSLGEILAQAGRFCVPDSTANSPLADLDYALRWNVPAYTKLLVARAQHMGIRHIPASTIAVEPDGKGGVAALMLDGAERVEADLYVDCSGPDAFVWSALPEARRVDWSSALPIRHLFSGPPRNGLAALEDRMTLVKCGWVSEFAGRDTLQTLLAVPDGISLEQITATLHSEPLTAVPLQPCCAERPWLANVVALGDAAAQFEPLGGLSVDLAHRQLELLLEMLPGRFIEPLERAEYNRRAELMAGRLRDTLGVHYTAQNASLIFGSLGRSDVLESTLDQFFRRGRLPFWEEAPLLGKELSSLLHALGIPGGEGPAAKASPIYEREEKQAEFAAQARAALEFAPPYVEWLASIPPGPAS